MHDPTRFLSQHPASSLTYMSIHHILALWEADGTLTAVRRAVEVKPAVRCVMATRLVHSLLSGPTWNSHREEERYRTVKAVIDGFIDGNAMRVRLPPSKSIQAALALLDPADAGVWEFRTRPDKQRNRSRYGVRVFGIFAERDLFVAYSTVFKEDLLDTTEYTRELEFCRRQWRTHFYPYLPVVGATLDDYVSNCLPC